MGGGCVRAKCYFQKKMAGNVFFQSKSFFFLCSTYGVCGCLFRSPVLCPTKVKAFAHACSLSLSSLHPPPFIHRTTMTSPTGSVSDLIATGTGGSGTSDTLDASTFIDPFSESNPFAEDAPSSTISPYLRTSQSLNFHEYYPQPSTSEGDDTTGSGHMYNSTSFHKSFSAMNLAGNTQYDATEPSSFYGETGAYSSTPALETTTHEEQTVEEGGGHRRWDSVDSNPRYDSDEQHIPTRDSNEGHYRPESTRSLGSTV